MRFLEIDRTILLVLFAIGLSLSVVFHIGYFRYIGIEFITMVSITDHLISVTFLFPVILLVFIFFSSIVVLLNLMPPRRSEVISYDIERSIQLESVSEDRALELSVIITGFIFGFLLAAPGIYFVYYGEISYAEVYVFATMIPIISGLSIYIAWGIRHTGTIKLRAAVTMVMLLSIFTWFLGGSYARNFAGQECKFLYLDEKEYSALFLRATYNGFLLKEDKVTRWVSGSIIKEISCERNIDKIIRDNYSGKALEAGTK